MVLYHLQTLYSKIGTSRMTIVSAFRIFSAVCFGHNFDLVIKKAWIVLKIKEQLVGVIHGSCMFLHYILWPLSFHGSCVAKSGCMAHEYLSEKETRIH